MMRQFHRTLAISISVLGMLLSAAEPAYALTFVGPSTITIDGSFPTSEWGTTSAPASGVYLVRDFTNFIPPDGNGYGGTPADINYFWIASSTQSGGNAPASPTNLMQNIYYRIDTFSTGVIKPGQVYNIQLNLGAAGANKADHMLQIYVLDTATPKISIVMSSYNTPYPNLGAYTSGSLTGRVSNIASPYPGYSGVVDTNATGAYGKYDGTNYGIEVKIPISWFGSSYGGLIKADGTGSATYYGTIFTSTGNLGSVGTVKDTIGKSDGTPIYFVVDPVTGEVNFEDLKLVNIVATKTDSIYTDVSPTGTASPGDVLLYTVVVTNSGTNTANSVVFQDTITDPNLTWCDNVTTTAGTIGSGNAAGSNGCTVNISSLAAGASATIRFRAQIKSPLASAASKVTNQGLVSGSNFTSVATDDPDTALASDATWTAITPTDMVEPYKTWALTADADGNGYPSPGDTITYTVNIENLGTISADNTTFNDVPDSNSTLVAGSVTTTRGTVTRGNTAGDRSVSVNLGSVPPTQGTPVTVTFRATINNPLPFGITRLSNQGTASGSNFPTDPTDDPTDQSYDNPTITPVTAAPLIEAFKRWELTDDADGNGLPSPNDNLTYVITIANKGNQNAAGVIFTDTVDPNTTLVVGSTIVSQGSITLQTAAGLSVNIGAIPGGNYMVTISFKVTIKSGASGGVSNYGTVEGSNFTSLRTDDPNTHTLNDATYTALAAGPPNLGVTKSAILYTDADNNGVASPGDSLQYIVAINNSGAGPADNVTFSDTVDSNCTVVGSSTTVSQGVVTSETASSISAYIGTLQGGPTHSICLVTFRVLINNPFPVNTDNITNQGTVSYRYLGIPQPSIPTDDPNTSASPDSTTTAVYADPLITATKADSVFTDADHNGIPSPGDTLLYTITIRNTGTTTGIGAIFLDTITDPNLTLQSSSVSTTQGTVIKGNIPADRAVQVSLDNLAVGTPVTITFKATVTNPLPAGVNKVSNQATVYGSNFPSTPSDDPRTTLLNDPTNTSLTAAPAVEPFKTYSLATDADHNGYPSPGDTLAYTVTIENGGNQDATDVIFSDTPDSNSTLVSGSVTTTQGTVATGNSPGDGSVKVNLGSLAGGQSVTATVRFNVLINSPLPIGVTQISNQGFVSGSNFPSDPTDDPTDQSYDNPTVTPVTAAPLIEAFKRYELTGDVNSNGLANPGDNLTYIVTINNKGNQNAADVVFTDTVDTSTSVIIGTTIASQGSIISETATGITVGVGTILGGGNSASISFVVTIKESAAGVVSNQGMVSGSNFTTIFTDDPNTHTLDDATYTALAVGSPEMHVTKSATLAIDADNNGMPSPGDTMQYIVAINNNGASAAQSVVFTDTVDPNTTIITGSTTTSQGSVASETAGAITVNVGTLPGGASHSICLVTFRVSINSPLPLDTTSISNQGLVSGGNFTALSTDDPNTPSIPPSPDPTVFTAYATPGIYAAKSASLFTDADLNGIPSPGDTLLYTIVIINSGNTSAKSVIFDDVIVDSNLTMAGNVTFSPALPGRSVLLGNSGGNEVKVNLDEVAASENATVTFRATIANHLPAGVESVTNQGLVTGSNFSTVFTDNPATTLQGDPTNTSLTASPVVEPYKTWALATDADNNGYPSPGDTITYTITLENPGNQAAAGVFFTDVPDANSSLVAGSVTSSQGTVVTGNGSSDNQVVVNLGTISGDYGRATVHFNVRVISALPSGVTQISNQGYVSGSNFPADPTDDPTDQSYDNPTIIALTAAPMVEASKTYQLSNDINGNGFADPGDSITYFINIVNNGNQNAAGVVFDDTVDTNTTVNIGSTTTSHGIVTNETATGVTVSIGTLNAGSSASISFTVTIKVIPGLTVISNQGSVSGINFNQSLTDDPGTTRLNDATDTHMALLPSLHVTKAVILADDADKTGLPSPGDTLQYIVTINNDGNGPADNLTFTDSPDSNTTLVAGSVSTTLGTVQLGNIAGDTGVRVYAGTLAGGQSHSVCLVTFKVTINNPLPDGTTAISNQGLATAAGALSILTEDPRVPGSQSSPTYTTLGPSPVIPTPPTPTPTPTPAPPPAPAIVSHGASTTTLDAKQWLPTTVALPNITVQSVSLSATETAPGTPVTVTAVIANKGKAAGTAKVTLYVDGEADSSYGVSVSSGSAKSLQFNVKRDQPGTYSVFVDSMPAGKVTVQNAVEPGFVFGISSALVISALVLAIVYVRRKQQGYY